MRFPIVKLFSFSHLNLWIRLVDMLFPLLKFFCVVYQDTFDAGLQAFEKEGIQTITGLKDRLIASKHQQTPAIEKRYNDVMTRYSRCFT